METVQKDFQENETVFIVDKEMLAEITGYSIPTITAAFNGTREGTDATRTIKKAWNELKTYQKITTHSAVEILKSKYHRKDAA